MYVSSPDLVMSCKYAADTYAYKPSPKKMQLGTLEKIDYNIV